MTEGGKTPGGEARVAGHFGELVQGRLGAAGPVVVISLPCAALWMRAEVRAGRQFHLAPQRVVSAARARRFLNDLGLALRCPVRLCTNMPVGGGAGSSTAALVALARAAGWRGEAQTLAAACLRSEGASDPLMFAGAGRMVWASRAGVVAGHLPPLPAFEVVGGFHGPGLRTQAGDDAFPDVADLIEAWVRAAGQGDLAALARIAATSAERTLALRAPGMPDPTAGLARALGALGHLIAHTGSARGLIFAPGAVPPDAAAALRAAGLRHVLRFRAGGAEA